MCLSGILLGVRGGGVYLMKKSIYIFSNGELKRKDNTFFIEKEDGKKNYLPIENINDIYIFGEVSVTKKFLELMSQKEIVLHFFNYYGYYSGSFYPREHYNSGYMILNQSKYYFDKEKRLNLARSFVNGSYINMSKVLTYYNNRGRHVEEYILRIDNLAEKIQTSESIEELMAIEGNMWNYYYQSFEKIIDNDDFKFQQRTKQPPKNYLNAMISFGNSLLYVAILSEIYKTHLDPRIGYLHTTNNRSFTLNLDLSEIFKPIIVDRTIFKVVNTNMITADGFDKNMGGILLSEKGRKTFIKEFEDKMNSTIRHPKLGRNVSYRRLIRLECYKLQKHFMGEEIYEPFKARW